MFLYELDLYDMNMCPIRQYVSIAQHRGMFLYLQCVPAADIRTDANHLQNYKKLLKIEIARVLKLTCEFLIFSDALRVLVAYFKLRQRALL
jgi:hypothetical protein